MEGLAIAYGPKESEAIMAPETDPLDPERARKFLGDVWADVDRWQNETHDRRITPERAREIEQGIILAIDAWKTGTLAPSLAEMLLRRDMKMCEIMAKVTSGALVLCRRLAEQIAEPEDGRRAVS